MNRTFWSLLPLSLLLAAPALAQPVETFATVDALVDAYDTGQVTEGDYVRVTKVLATDELRPIGHGGDFYDRDEYLYTAADANGQYEITVALAGYFDASYDPTGTIDMAAEGIDSTQIGFDIPDVRRGYELEAQGFLEFRGADGMFLTTPIGNGFTKAYDDRHYDFGIQNNSWGWSWWGDHELTYHSQVHDPMDAPANLRLRPSGTLRPGQLMIVSADGISATQTYGRLVRSDGSQRTLDPVMRTASVVLFLLPHDTYDGTHELFLLNSSTRISAPLSIDVEGSAPVITSAVKIDRKVFVTLSRPLRITANVELRVWRYALENVRVEYDSSGRRVLVTGDLPSNPQADSGRTVKLRVDGGRWSRSRTMTQPARGAAGLIP